MPNISMATDEELRALTPAERSELIARLSRLSGGRPGMHVDPHKIRRNRIALVTIVAVGLVPWTVYLGITLPGEYVVRDWTLTWTGFDAILAVVLGSTALLALLRREAVVLAAFASGILLLGDAWFDVTTSSGADRVTAVAFAGLLELPFAGFLLLTSVQLLRLGLDAVTPRKDVPLWRVPLKVAA